MLFCRAMWAYCRTKLCSRCWKWSINRWDLCRLCSERGQTVNYLYLKALQLSRLLYAPRACVYAERSLCHCLSLSPLVSLSLAVCVCHFHCQCHRPRPRPSAAGGVPGRVHLHSQYQRHETAQDAAQHALQPLRYTFADTQTFTHYILHIWKSHPENSSSVVHFPVIFHHTKQNLVRCTKFIKLMVTQKYQCQRQGRATK